MNNFNGGPAFPGPTQREQRVDINEGMSLRDWFAGMALIARGNGSYNSWEAMAEDCCEIADAMLKRLEAKS